MSVSVDAPAEIDDQRVAIAAARQAAAILVALRTDGADVATGASLGAQADRRSHEALVSELSRQRPEDWILSEEGTDDPARVGRDRVWIIDPLDGTHEYGEPGRTDWAVHVALVTSGRLALGVVALPALGLTLSSDRPPRLPHRSGPLRVVVSRSRPPALAVNVSRRLGATLIPMGSAGAKAMSILMGWADVYLHGGGQHEWDSAAPVAVALAAGLHASRLDGSPLSYNHHPAWLPDLVVCRPELARAVLGAIRAASE